MSVNSLDSAHRDYVRIVHLLDVLYNFREEVSKIPISQEQFDQDLAALVASVTNLINAIEAWIASHGPADLSAEDQAVQAAAQAVADEIARLQPPPPP